MEWSLDQSLAQTGPAGGTAVESGLVHTFQQVQPGTHTVYVGPVNADNELIGEIVSQTFNVLKTSGPLVSVTFGSSFEGEDASIFTTSDGKGLDSANSGLLAFGYFNDGFDAAAAAEFGDTSSLISHFNLLKSSTFDSVSAAGYLSTGGTYVQNGVGLKPYLFLLSGITDFAKADSSRVWSVF